MYYEIMRTSMNHFLTRIIFCLVSHALYATENATLTGHDIALLGGKCIIALTAEIEAHNNLKNHLVSLEPSFFYDFEQYKTYVEPKNITLLAKRFCVYDQSTNKLFHIYNQACHNRFETKKILAANLLKLNASNSESEYIKHLQDRINITIAQIRQTNDFYQKYITELATNDILLCSQLNKGISLSKIISEAVKRYPQDQFLIFFNHNFQTCIRDFSNLATECEDYAIQAYINNANTNFLDNYLQMIDETFPEFKKLNNIK